MSLELEQRVNHGESRIAAVETSVDSLLSSFNAWRTESRDESHALRGDIKALVEMQNNAQRFPVAPSIAFAGLIFLTMGSFFAVMSGTDNRIELGLIKLTDAVIRHQVDGHPKVQQEAILSLKSNLARVEMASTTHVEIDAIVSSMKEKSEILNDEINLVRKWQREHNQRVVGLNAAQWERIKGLERKVFSEKMNKAVGDKY